jgi:DNA polymerase
VPFTPITTVVGKAVTPYCFSIEPKEQHLFMRFPNGKLLSFPFAKYEMWKMPWGKMQMSVTHMWINTQNGNKWERRGISGASLMQSAVQGLSGQLLFEANLRLVKAGYDVRFRVHDELTALVPDDASSSLDHFTKVFTESPEWAEGLPIAADPWRNRRYKK